MRTSRVRVVKVSDKVVVTAILFFWLDCLDEKSVIENWNINRCGVVLIGVPMLAVVLFVLG